MSPTVRFQEPVQISSPSRTANLWCMIAERSSGTIVMPASRTILSAFWVASSRTALTVSVSVTIRTATPRVFARTIAWATFSRSNS